eukprot:gene31101-6231_t
MAAEEGGEAQEAQAQGQRSINPSAAGIITWLEVVGSQQLSTWLIWSDGVAGSEDCFSTDFRELDVRRHCLADNAIDRAVLRAEHSSSIAASCFTESCAHLDVLGDQSRSRHCSSNLNGYAFVRDSDRARTGGAWERSRPAASNSPSRISSLLRNCSIVKQLPYGPYDLYHSLSTNPFPAPISLQIEPASLWARQIAHQSSFLRAHTTSITSLPPNPSTLSLFPIQIIVSSFLMGTYDLYHSSSNQPITPCPYFPIPDHREQLPYGNIQTLYHSLSNPTITLPLFPIQIIVNSFHMGTDDLVHSPHMGPDNPGTIDKSTQESLDFTLVKLFSSAGANHKIAGIDADMHVTQINELASVDICNTPDRPRASSWSVYASLAANLETKNLQTPMNRPTLKHVALFHSPVGGKDDFPNPHLPALLSNPLPTGHTTSTFYVETERESLGFPSLIGKLSSLQPSIMSLGSSTFSVETERESLIFPSLVGQLSRPLPNIKTVESNTDSALYDLPEPPRLPRAVSVILLNSSVDFPLWQRRRFPSSAQLRAYAEVKLDPYADASDRFLVAALAGPKAQRGYSYSATAPAPPQFQRSKSMGSPLMLRRLPNKSTKVEVNTDPFARLSDKSTKVEVNTDPFARLSDKSTKVKVNTDPFARLSNKSTKVEVNTDPFYRRSHQTFASPSVPTGSIMQAAIQMSLSVTGMNTSLGSISRRSNSSIDPTPMPMDLVSPVAKIPKAKSPKAKRSSYQRCSLTPADRELLGM